MFEVEYFTLGTGGTDASNKYVPLAGTPLSASNVAMDTIGGTAQSLNGDFAVDGTKIRWDGYGLDGTYGQLLNGDNIRVIYDRS